MPSFLARLGWKCRFCGDGDPFARDSKCPYRRMHFMLFCDWEERERKSTMPMYVILDSPVVGTGTMEEFRRYLTITVVNRKPVNPVIPKEEKTMRLEMAILAGDESKKFLADLTKQIDRLEALSAGLKGKTAKASEDEAPPEATPAPAAADEDEDEDFSAKPAKGKGKAAAAKSFDEDEDEDEAESEDEAENEDEEKPAKKEKAKAKKFTADDVNDACKKHAKTHGRDATLKVLKKKFKVESVTELKPEQYEEVIKAVAVDEDEE